MRTEWTPEQVVALSCEAEDRQRDVPASLLMTCVGRWNGEQPVLPGESFAAWSARREGFSVSGTLGAL